MKERLHVARRRADISWLALADRSGVSSRHVRRLAEGDGDINCTLDVVQRLAHVLGVRPGWLAFGEGEIDG